jgi:hypothetical protein
LYSIRPTDGSGDFTFSRGSNLAATRVDVNGLIEKAKVNNLRYSNVFDNANWVKSSVSVTGGQTGFDGSSNAWLLTKTGTNGSIYQSQSYSGLQTLSFYAKANTTDWVRLRNGSGYSYFDVANGVVGGTIIDIDSSITSVGGGWYRIAVAYNGTIGISQLYVADSDGDTSGTSGSVYIQFPQLEEGLVARQYVDAPTDAVVEGLTADLPRLDYSGGASCPSLLLEPQRTNLVEYSEYFQEWHTNSNVSFSTNEATSPEGLTNATKLTATSTSNSYVRDNLNAPAGNNVFSVFAKYEDCQYISLRSNFYTGGDEFEVWFDIQNGVKGGSTGDNVTYNIEDYGNDWYRCYAVFNIDAGDTSGYCYVYLSSTDESFNVVNGTGALLYGGQLEAGTYPTSYIPTYGTSQTRSSRYRHH